MILSSLMKMIPDALKRFQLIKNVVGYEIILSSLLNMDRSWNKTVTFTEDLEWPKNLNF